MGELFECQNCYHSSQLDVHGRCVKCGSESVISLHRIMIEQVNSDLNQLFSSDELKTLFGVVLEEVAQA